MLELTKIVKNLNVKTYQNSEKSKCKDLPKQ